MQAAVLLVKLRYLQEWTERRRANAALYRECLAGIPQIHIPIDRPGDRAVYHTFVIQAERREALRNPWSCRVSGPRFITRVPIHLSTAGRGSWVRPGRLPRGRSVRPRASSACPCIRKWGRRRSGAFPIRSAASTTRDASEPLIEESLDHGHYRPGRVVSQRSPSVGRV